MRPFPRSTILLAFALAVLLPLEQVHCASAGVGAGGADADANEHHASDGHHAHQHPATPTRAPEPDTCCSQLLTVVVPASVSVVPSSGGLMHLATIPPFAPERTPNFRELGDAAQLHSKSPPHPAVTPQSPRGPPLST